MTDIRQLLVHASQYLAGRAGLMLLGFVSFPLLTRLLPVAQYGELSLALKLCLLWTVLSKCGIQNAALRFFPEASRSSEAEKQACASTLILSAAAISLLLGAFGYLAMRTIGSRLGPAVSALAPLLLILALVRSIQPTFSGLLRSERRAWLFNACELSGKAGGILFSILALVLIATDLRYFIAGLVSAEALVMIAIAIWFYRAGLLSFRSFKPRLAREVIFFSLPLIAYELTSVILDSGDRLLVGRFLGLSQLGLYSAAYSIATYAEEALMTPVNMALMPAYMKIWVDQGAAATARFLSDSLDYFVMACGAVALLVYVTSTDLIGILASKKFAAAQTLLPVLVLGLLVYATHIFFNAPLIIHKRSIVLTTVTTVCCIANIFMNILFLPRLGIMGAAVSTLLSYILLVLGLLLVSRRYLSFRLPFATFVFCSILVVAIEKLMEQVAFASHWTDLFAKGGASLGLYSAGLIILRPKLRRSLFTGSRRVFAPETCLSEVEP
jgi:O-antigen/teichoic acid export membrane protein